MSSYDPDLICTREDDVLILTLNRGSKANSLTPALVEDLIWMVGHTPDHPIIAYHTISFANDR